MSKRKVEFIHEPMNNAVICCTRHNKFLGVGIANFKENGIEDHPTRLTGETVAHLKAEKDILRQKIQEKKKQLKIVNDFYIYMFPKKYNNILEKWLLPRADKYLNKIKQEISDLKNEINEIDRTLVEYLEQKRKFLERLNKKREVLASLEREQG